MKLDGFLQKLISWLFAGMFFLIPLFFTPLTFELFEFNKIILVYAFTTLISSLWLARMILARKMFFKRSFLDIPLILFLTSQLSSTLLSIDRHTSIFGYYSRFNGGFLSTISYLLLYWAFVSNCETDSVRRSIKASLISAAIISVYGILEHFGHSFSCLMFTGKFNVACWVQDVQNRVFATLGQPNWLAAYLVTLMPVAWVFTLNINSTHVISSPAKRDEKSSEALTTTLRVWISHFVRNDLAGYLLSVLFFSCLLFTDSRSGFLGLVVSAIVFWILVFWQNKDSLKIFRKPFLILNTCYLILIFAFGSPFPQINKYFSLQSLKSHFLARRSFSEGGPPSTHFSLPTPTPQLDTQIVTGGSESGEIRKIVWQGAIDIFKHYPLFGSGVETFAYAYYNFRPLSHNLVSEWDFLYNKAHNEYLNFLSTTGILGLGTYLLFIVTFVIWSLVQFKVQSAKCKVSVQNSKLTKGKLLTESYNFELLILNFALISGWLSILVTNFFGFSVVVTSLYFFLIPAFVFTLTSLPADQSAEALAEGEALAKTGRPQLTPTFHFSLLILIPIFCTFCIVHSTFNLWLADYYYSKGEKANKQAEYQQAITYLAKAITLSPSEPVFQSEASSVLASLAYLTKDTNASSSADFGQKAIALSDLAIDISPKNLNLWKTRVKVYYTLSTIEEKYLDKAIEAINTAMKLAPTDPKLVYNLGLLYGKAGDIDKALATIQRSVELKPNYADAHNALSIYYEDLKQPQKAIEQLEYILKYIAPDSKEAKDRLERLRR